MVAIEYIEGNSTFTINNITLVRNFHAYVYGSKVRIVNAYDTRNELLSYTLFSDISINGNTYASVAQLLDVLAPVLFLKQGGSSENGGGVPVVSGSNIITRVVTVPIDWTANSVQQIIDFVNNQSFTVSGSQRVLFKAIRIIGDIETSNASESYFWEFKPGKGNYGINGIDITSDDIEFISFVTNFQNNVIDLGEIGSTPIEIFINESGPYAIISSALNVFKSLRQGTPVNYLYIGNSTNIGDGQVQTVEDDFIDVNAEPVNPPASTSGLDVPLLQDYIPVSQADGSIVWEPKPAPSGGSQSGLTRVYATISAMIADQNNQFDLDQFRVNDASSDPTVTAGRANYEYLGTTNGTIDDYYKYSEEESIDFDNDYEARISALENDGYVTTSELEAAKQEAINDSKSYTDLQISYSNIWQNRYPDITSLLAGQNNQSIDRLQFVINASGDPTVNSGWAVYELLNSKNGLIGDYRKLDEQESLDVAAGGGTVSALQSFTAFLDGVNGNDATGVITDPSKPFKTYTALQNALPQTTQSMNQLWTIKIVSDGTFLIPNGIQVRALRFISDNAFVFDFSGLTYIINGGSGTRPTHYFEIPNGTFYSSTDSRYSQALSYCDVKYNGIVGKIDFNSTSTSRSIVGFEATDLTIGEFVFRNGYPLIFGGSVNVLNKLRILNLNVINTASTKFGNQGNVIIEDITGPGDVTLEVVSGRVQLNNISKTTGSITIASKEVHFNNCSIASGVSLKLNSSVKLVTGVFTSTDVYLTTTYYTGDIIFRNFRGKINSVLIYGTSNIIFEGDCYIESNTYAFKNTATFHIKGHTVFYQLGTGSIFNNASTGIMNIYGTVKRNRVSGVTDTIITDNP